MTSVRYREQVIHAIAELGGATPLDEREEKLIALGEHYSVGPGDCARQLLSDRLDAAGGGEDETA